jgi:ATP/maltotriose-dependent transcriptional regulator MalT
VQAGEKTAPCEDGGLIREREAELSLLHRLLADLDSTGGRVVLVRGEAGIGKTALVAAFVEATAGAVHVLEGGCDDLLTPQPFAPIWDIARREPSLGVPLAADDRRGVMDGLLDLLTRPAHPTVLVIEDTHWADEATLDIIRFLGRRIARANGVLVLTYRSGEVDAEHPLRQVIGELPPRNLVRMQLDRLSPSAVASMTEAADLDLDRVLALTDGNPLFVTEVIVAGVDQVPTSIQDAVLARASKLSPEARRVLDLVSITPGGTEATLLEHVLGPVDESLRECERRGLLTFDDAMVSFLHELTRQAIETTLSPADRRGLNEEALSALAGHGDPARLVHHARQAEDTLAIVDHAPKAARAAMAIESHREALEHFRAVEPHLDLVETHARAAILDDWARTAYMEGGRESPDIMTRAIDLRRSDDDPLPLARSLASAVRIYEVQGQPERAAACADEAVSILESRPPSADLAFAVSQRAWLCLMRGEEAEGSRIAGRALAIADEVGDDLVKVRSLVIKGACDYSLGDLAASRLVEQGHRLAQQSGYRLEEVYALVNLTGMAGDVRDLARAADLARRTVDTAVRYELRRLEAYARAQYAEILMWKGEWGAAEDEATESLGISDAHAEAVALRILGLIEARRGRAEARSPLDRAYLVAEESRELQHLDPAAAALAEHLWLSGSDDPDAISRIRRVFDRGLSTGPPWPSDAFGFWWWKLGCVDEVRDGLNPVYRRITEGGWQDGAAFWETRGMPYERALALMHGDDDARILAVRILEDLGAAAAAARVRGELLDRGVKISRGSSRATREHAAGLTARQAEVLELLGANLSNSQIADQLFVSQRTVENHVGAILMKLDVSNRTAAVEVARERGILDRG